jgi:bacteriophage N4 adsorption protein B
MDGGALLDAAAFLVRELALFAAVGFILLGASDLLVDFIWIGIKLKRLAVRVPQATLADLPPPERPGPFAVFIPAWQEAGVIGDMLRHALGTWPRDDIHLYVGCYPNDPATIAAVRAIDDPRIRLVVGEHPGPTTKADNLNTMWRALRADEAAGAEPFKAVVLHDAEDVVHSAEIDLFDRMIERFDLIQLPVVPLIAKRRGIGAHYLDEFAEAHSKELVVREALGASVPSAGVGCALSRRAMALLAGAGDRPFDADSLTEDYEVGLRLHAAGLKSAFVRLPAGRGGSAIATREHFPCRLRDAVTQKSRWIAGIALSGWERMGWSGGLAERWMRLRDRQSLLAALLLCTAYVVLLAGPLLAFAAEIVGHPIALMTPTLALLTTIGAALLVWRLLMRFAFVAACLGPIEGLRAIPRVIVSNAVTMLAAREAIGRYRRGRRTGESVWGKTDHIFPEQVPAE